MLVIQKLLVDIPQLPGVYQFICKEEILYIGKAKNLYKRVSNYIGGNLSSRIVRMVHAATDLKYQTTSSEGEALLLESLLIKKHQPKYNILLKDDKSFPYIKITNHRFPQIIKYRGKNLDQSFGPFASSRDIDQAIKEIQQLFKMRTCSDNYFTTRKRPCLLHQISRCSAPCVDRISREDYFNSVKHTLLYLKGKNAELQNLLMEKMLQYSQDMRYEEAAKIRDRLKSVSIIQSKTSISSLVSDVDVIGIYQKNNISCISLVIYRGGQNYGNRNYFPQHAKDDSYSAIMSSFIGQFYQNRIPPKKILIPSKIENQDNLVIALNMLNTQSSVKIIEPIKPELEMLLDSAQQNAKIAYNSHEKSFLKQNNLYQEIQRSFFMEKAINRIEVYDNSHIMGKYAVGAVIVAERDGFVRSEYRRYKVSSSKSENITGGDDYYMLQQVLNKRFQKVRVIPELIIIDGGKGQLSVALKTLNKYNLSDTIKIVAMAKGKYRNKGNETFFLDDGNIVLLQNDSIVMKYIQILRDEVHNFAIQGYKNKHKKMIYESNLDSISGVGTAMKNKLLSYFGSFSALQQASTQQLVKIPGIGEKKAKEIFRFLHGYK